MITPGMSFFVCRLLFCFFLATLEYLRWTHPLRLVYNNKHLANDHIPSKRCLCIFLFQNLSFEARKQNDIDIFIDSSR